VEQNDILPMEERKEKKNEGKKKGDGFE